MMRLWVTLQNKDNTMQRADSLAGCVCSFGLTLSSQTRSVSPSISVCVFGSVTFRCSLGGSRWETEEQSNAAVEELRSSKKHLSRYQLQEASCQYSSCTLSFFPSDTHTHTHATDNMKETLHMSAFGGSSIRGGPSVF